MISLHHRFDDLLGDSVVHSDGFIEMLLAFARHVCIQVPPAAAPEFEFSRGGDFESTTARFMGFQLRHGWPVNDC